MGREVLLYATKTAREAGEIIRQYFGKPLHHRTKGRDANDFVTEADLRSEELIIRRIQERFPNDGIISEESKPLISSGAPRTWIIDPLDGTYNFTHGIKNCGVMITRTEREEVQLAVLYNPFKGALAFAVRGEGVFVNGERKRLGMLNDNLSIIADDKGFAPILKKMSLRVIDLWSSIDNALSVLTGEKNAYFNRTAKVWDLAPLSLCFEEYGLRVLSADQKLYRWNSKSQALVAVSPDQLADIRSVFLEE